MPLERRPGAPGARLMPVEHTDEPEAGARPPAATPRRLKRLKYSTVAEILADVDAMNYTRGIKHCPVHDYLAAHLGDDRDSQW